MKTIFFIFVFLFTALTCIPMQAQADEKASGSSAALVDTAVNQQLPDNRALVLSVFLAKNNSPLAQYADIFVKEADKNHIPWDLVPAIAGTESTFGQEVPWETCYNAWGYGIYGNNTLCFPSYPEAIKTISKALRDQYMNKWGAQDVYGIGSLYAASPTWADHTLFFMHQIEALQAQMAMQSLPISL